MSVRASGLRDESAAREERGRRMTRTTIKRSTVEVRTTEEWTPGCEWTKDEVEVYLMGPFDGEIPGLVRRVRRILDVSQRGLAALIGVSQSVVARWETGRTSPRVSVLHQLLRLAGLDTTVHDPGTGVEVEPMRDDGARDRGGRRYPAHVDLMATGWYVPRGLDCTLDAKKWERSSRRRELPRVRYEASRYLRWRWRSAFGTPIASTPTILTIS